MCMTFIALYSRNVFLILSIVGATINHLPPCACCFLYHLYLLKIMSIKLKSSSTSMIKFISICNCLKMETYIALTHRIYSTFHKVEVEYRTRWSQAPMLNCYFYNTENVFFLIFFLHMFGVCFDCFLRKDSIYDIYSVPNEFHYTNKCWWKTVIVLNYRNSEGLP